MFEQYDRFVNHYINQSIINHLIISLLSQQNQSINQSVSKATQINQSTIYQSINQSTFILQVVLRYDQCVYHQSLKQPSPTMVTARVMQPLRGPPSSLDTVCRRYSLLATCIYTENQERLLTGPPNTWIRPNLYKTGNYYVD